MATLEGWGLMEGGDEGVFYVKAFLHQDDDGVARCYGWYYYFGAVREILGMCLVVTTPLLPTRRMFALAVMLLIVARDPGVQIAARQYLEKHRT